MTAHVARESMVINGKGIGELEGFPAMEEVADAVELSPSVTAELAFLPPGVKIKVNGTDRGHPGLRQPPVFKPRASSLPSRRCVPCSRRLA